MTLIIRPNAISEFLGQELFRFFGVIVDLWTFVHLGSGFLLGLLVTEAHVEEAFHLPAWLSVLILLLLYEGFEWALTGRLFRLETPANIVWDIVVGMAGYGLFRLLQFFIFKG